MKLEHANSCATWYQKYYDNEISYAMRKYLDLQLSMSNVVNGVWSSYVEPAMGLHESRRYSRPTSTY